MSTAGLSESSIGYHGPGNCGYSEAVTVAKGSALMSMVDMQWQRHLVLGENWRIFVRPIRPDDDHLIRGLLAHVSKEDLRLRFFDSIKEFSPQFIARLTQLDFTRSMAFAAIDEAGSE